MEKKFLREITYLYLQITGMPAGHPFQGSQPKHLEDLNRSPGPIALPRKPYLTSKRALVSMTDENYDTGKMMRYDDFTNEDVGNIIMDAEPKADFEEEEKNPLLASELIAKANRVPGIQEFDEKIKKTSYQTSGNRHVFQARNPNRFKRRLRPGLQQQPQQNAFRQQRLRHQGLHQNRPRLRRFPNRPGQFRRRPQGTPGGVQQQTLQDTFEYNGNEYGTDFGTEFRHSDEGLFEDGPPPRNEQDFFDSVDVTHSNYHNELPPIIEPEDFEPEVFNKYVTTI